MVRPVPAFFPQRREKCEEALGYLFAAKPQAAAMGKKKDRVRSIAGNDFLLLFLVGTAKTGAGRNRLLY